MTGVLWYKRHHLISGDTSALIAYTGTRHGLLGRERSYGDTRAGAVDVLEPGEPLTCGLLPLLIKKICRAYGGAGGEPLQPRPGFKLDRKRGRVRLQELLKRDGSGFVPLALYLLCHPKPGPGDGCVVQ